MNHHPSIKPFWVVLLFSASCWSIPVPAAGANPPPYLGGRASHSSFYGRENAVNRPRPW